MELDNKYYANDGDLLYTWSATFGPHIWHGGKVIYHYHIWKIELSNKLRKQFAVELLLRDKALLENNTNGSTMPHITKSGMENKRVKIPLDIDEQDKIGLLLNRLDKVISLHHRKIVLLQQLKKGLLQKMFADSKQTKPILRFKNFTSAWEQLKLKDIANKITKGTTPRDKSGNGTVNFIKVENISNNVIHNSSFKITKEENDGYLKRSILKDNDILFSIAGTLGRVGIVGKENLPANTNQALAIIRGYTLDKNFFITLLEGNSVKKYIHANPTVGAQPNLSLKQVGELTFSVPDINEQSKIGKLINKVNSTITLHQYKLDKLNQFKQGLLQQMFI